MTHETIQLSFLNLVLNILNLPKDRLHFISTKELYNNPFFKEKETIREFKNSITDMHNRPAHWFKKKSRGFKRRKFELK